MTALHRRFGQGCIILGLAAALPWAAPARAQVVKIGVISTYSGPQATLGDQIDKGFSLFLSEHQKDLPPGVTIELIRRDDGGPNPELAKRLAQELITREHVQILTGAVWTPNVAATAPLLTESKMPLVIMNASGSVLTRLSPYIVRTSFTQWQVTSPIGTWAAKQGLKKGYTAVSDFAPGYDAENAFAKGFKDAGGEIVGAVRFPVENPDFIPFLQRIKDTKPDVVYLFVPSGAQATQEMKAYGDLGLKEAGITAVGSQDIVPDYGLPAMGDAPLGLVTSGTYTPAAPRPQNRAFVAAWDHAYGAKSIPDVMAVDAWDGMAAIVALIAETKGQFDGDQAVAFLREWKNPESPRGPIAIDPETRDIVQNIYIRKVERQNGALANVEFDTIPQVKDPWKQQNPPK